ncbi:MAG: hypothetical protein OEX13_14405 [Gammaproteobacteria bacterium]|nr:hypothetical protein [Gammaproteobacteria bacterium]
MTAMAELLARPGVPARCESERGEMRKPSGETVDERIGQQQAH